jgi:hypothetical protein
MREQNKDGLPDRTWSRRAPESSLTTRAPDTAAMSASTARRPSPKPGALTAHTRIDDRSLLTMSVASASPAPVGSTSHGTAPWDNTRTFHVIRNNEQPPATLHRCFKHRDDICDACETQSAGSRLKATQARL